MYCAFLYLSIYIYFYISISKKAKIGEKRTQEQFLFLWNGKIIKIWRHQWFIPLPIPSTYITLFGLFLALILEVEQNDWILLLLLEILCRQWRPEGWNPWTLPNSCFTSWWCFARPLPYLSSTVWGTLYYHPFVSWGWGLETNQATAEYSTSFP